MTITPMTGLPAATSAGANGSAGQSEFQKFGMAMRFRVKIDDLSLGHWASCEGLEVKFDTEKITSGGYYDRKVILPKDISYERITLKRAMITGDSQAVRNWLKKVADEWVNWQPGQEPYIAQGGTITLLDVTGRDVQEWKLEGVYPVSWRGPALNAKQSEIACETLVIEHDGFL